MSEFSWDGKVIDEAAQQQGDDPAAVAETLALSADDFAGLEERILRAVNLVKRERKVRIEAEERLTETETQLHEQTALVETMQLELTSLRAERDHVRQRVDRLLAQLDSLEL